MYLIVKNNQVAGTTTRAAHIVTTVQACTDIESLEDYILRHGLEDCKVYNATEMTIEINPVEKKSRN